MIFFESSHVFICSTKLFACNICPPVSVNNSDVAERNQLVKTNGETVGNHFGNHLGTIWGNHLGNHSGNPFGDHLGNHLENHLGISLGTILGGSVNENL